MVRYNAYDGIAGRIFAAALPLAGGESDPEFSTQGSLPANSIPTQAVVDELRGVPIWAVHGYYDAPQFDQSMAKALGTDGAYRYTELQANHDVWDLTYPLPDGKPYYDWLFAQSSGVVTPPVSSMVSWVVAGTGASATVALEKPGAGGPSYLEWSFVWSGAEGVALSTQAPNVFLHGGPGQDALQVASGHNVLDGGTGSNFLVGGSGTDTFFTDARGSAVVWNTLVNFHAGDAATLWGFVPGVSSYRWEAAAAGAEGATGATLRANIVGGAGRSGDGIDASVTFAGLGVEQARGLTVTTGSQAAGSYLFLYAAA